MSADTVLPSEEHSGVWGTQPLLAWAANHPKGGCRALSACRAVTAARAAVG